MGPIPSSEIASEYLGEEKLLACRLSGNNGPVLGCPDGSLYFKFSERHINHEKVHVQHRSP